ncbi:MAG: transcription-repair coupling factor, partial [Spirochaetota bacterium]|nr:transcription-repair coupling factor [Spirochaetota bacterium]
RGAGNVLGMEQSGSIVSVGFELYCKLLDEAVSELATGEKYFDTDIYVDLKYDGYIPDEYIPDEKQKIEVYKKLAGAVSEDDIEKLILELADRFGKAPLIIDNLLKLAEVKVIGRGIKVVSIVEKGNEVHVEFNERSEVRPERILVLAGIYKDILRLNPAESRVLHLKIAHYPLKDKVSFLKQILSEMKG